MTDTQKQCLLRYLGYYNGPVDGIWGKASRQATRDFQSEQGLEADGIFGSLTQQAAIAAVADPEGFWRQITHFQKQEFRCPCGSCGGFPAQPQRKLVELAQAVREHFGAPCHISSGVRCERHNKAVGGVQNSRHLTGKAADFRVEGRSARAVLEYVQTLPGVRYCYAIDGNFIHMDIG